VIAGVFEPGVEAILPGVIVRLRSANGVSLLDTTTTNDDGEYEFANLDAGVYQVEFEDPTGRRLVRANLVS
jgi:uncharacterized surface anchored protein